MIHLTERKRTAENPEIPLKQKAEEEKSGKSEQLRQDSKTGS